MFKNIGKKITIITIFVIGLVIYLLMNKGVAGNIDSSSVLLKFPFTGKISAFELSHERSAYGTLVSLDETGRTDLSPGLADAAAPDAGYYRGKYYSFFPPGLAFSAWPFYEVGKHYNYSLAASYFMVSIFAVLGLILIFKICDEMFKFPRWLSLFVAISTGFASTYLNFSITFYQHVPSTFLLLLSFYSAWRYSKNYNWLWAAVCWSCYGVASFFDYPNLIIFIPVLIYLIYKGVYLSKEEGKTKFGIRNSLVISAIFLILLGVTHMYYNQANYGSWSKFSNTLPRFDPRQEGLGQVELDASDIEKLAKEKTNVSYSFQETNLINGFYVLLFDIDKSLLLHMPIFLLAFLGIYTARKKFTMEIWTMIFIILVNIILYSSFFDPWGGWGFGPRYLVTCMPFIGILVGFWLENAKLLKRIIVLPIVIYSAGVAVLGALTKNFLVPKVEILPFILPYKFWGEFKFLKMNENGTLVYNVFLSHKYSLTQYFIGLWVGISIIFVIILFILPYLKYGNKHQENQD